MSIAFKRLVITDAILNVDGHGQHIQDNSLCLMVSGRRRMPTSRYTALMDDISLFKHVYALCL